MAKTKFKPKEPIPEFKSRKEEAEFFDTHDMADYWEEFEPVKIKASFPLSKRLELRIDGETAQKLEKEANKKGVGPSTLARMWIKEKLQTI